MSLRGDPAPPEPGSSNVSASHPPEHRGRIDPVISTLVSTLAEHVIAAYQMNFDSVEEKLGASELLVYA